VVLDERVHLCRLFQRQNVILMLMANALKPAKDGLSVWLALELLDQVRDNVGCMDALLTTEEADGQN
jgi:hypothetical protein